jgi:hypothetical protein
VISAPSVGRVDLKIVGCKNMVGIVINIYHFKTFSSLSAVGGQG